MNNKKRRPRLYFYKILYKFYLAFSVFGIQKRIVTDCIECDCIIIHLVVPKHSIISEFRTLGLCPEL